jgi:hypothetical protein
MEALVPVRAWQKDEGSSSPPCHTEVFPKPGSSLRDEFRVAERDQGDVGRGREERGGRDEHLLESLFDKLLCCLWACKALVGGAVRQQVLEKQGGWWKGGSERTGLSIGLGSHRANPRRRSGAQSDGQSGPPTPQHTTVPAAAARNACPPASRFGRGCQKENFSGLVWSVCG